MQESIFEKVKARANIQEVVERFAAVNFTRDRKCCCPFPDHRDDTPSFSIEPRKNIFKCFGCGEKGDAIKFVEKIRGVSPLEAAKMIADLYGITDDPAGGAGRVDKIPVSERKTHPSAPQRATEREIETGALPQKKREAFIRKSIGNLSKTDYLKTRGFTDETIERFCLGYDPSGDPEFDGVVVPYSRKRDYYIKRLLNPPDPKRPYRKPKSTDWGSDRIFNAEALSGTESVFVVESQFCAISIAQVGGVAAALGGLGQRDLFLYEMEKRKPKCRLIIAFDNDPPGKKAQPEFVERLREAGVTFIEYNVAGECKDPNDLLKINPDALAANVKKAIKEVTKVQETEHLKQKEQSRADEVNALLSAELPSDIATRIYDGDYIDALIYARNNQAGVFAKFKARLKAAKTGVNMNDLERTVNQEADSRKKEQRASATPAAEAITLGECEPLKLDGIDLGGAVLPPRYRMSMERGVTRVVSAKDGESEVAVCPHPIVVTKILSNIDDDADGLEVSVFRFNKWKQIFGKRKQFSAAQSIIDFADKGIRVTSGTAAELINFLAAYETANPAAIPERISLDRLGWITETEFYPFATDNEVVFEAGRESEKMLKKLSECGSYDKWKTLARELRKNPFARFIISASFASPLLHKINCRTFVIHLWGDSTAGKTAVLKTAISAWGNITSNGLMVNANATPVGLEQFCATLKHLPFGVDEKQAASSNKFDAETTIYMLAEGQGKVRGAKGGGNQEMLYWNNVVIFTGETPMTQGNTMDGAQNRILEINERPVPNLELAKSAHRITADNYGYAGREFIREIVSRLKTHPEFLKQEYEDILKKFAAHDMTNAHSDYIAAVALGDILAETVIFGTEINVARAEAFELSKTVYLNNLAGQRGSVNLRAYDFVHGWLISNQNRFNRTKEDNLSTWGRYDNRGETAYYDDYYIIPQYLEDALAEAGFNLTKSVKYFIEKQFLIPTYKSDGTKERDTYKQRLSGGQAPIWTYYFRVKKNDPPPLQPRFTELTPVADGELPF